VSVSCLFGRLETSTHVVTFGSAFLKFIVRLTDKSPLENQDKKKYHKQSTLLPLFEKE